MALVIRDNIDDYNREERLAVEQAYNELEEKSQGGELTLEETRIRVAWVRLKREENFKIAMPSVRAKKGNVKESLEDAIAGLSGETATPKAKRVAKVKVKKEAEIVKDNGARAGFLLYLKQKGEILSAVDEAFLQAALEAPEVL
jgi:hypothetical protein